MTVIELRERAIAEAQAARDIKDKVDADGRGMTEEEANEFEKHLKESKRIGKEADRQEDLEAVEATLAEPEKRQSTPEIATGERIEVIAPKLFRYGELRAFRGPKAEANAYRSGRWLLATMLGHAHSRQWCRDHCVEIRSATFEGEERAQVESVNTKGGWLVPDEMERAIIDLREEYGDFRRNARIHPMSSDHTYIPRRTGGVTAYAIGETTEITESEKSWNQVELTAKKWGALTRISTDLTEDAIISVADDLADEMAYAFAEKEDTCGIDGDGTSTYHSMVGIRTKMIDGNHVGSYVENAAGQDEWAEITTASLTAIMAALPKYARRNAKWYCSPTAKVAVFDRLLMAAGGNTNQNLAEGQPARYAGYPIVEMPAMPSDDTSAALNAKIMLFFGDLRKAATIGTRRGFILKTTQERYIEFDQIGIQATTRWCINVHDIGGAAGVRGPVVGMLGNT